MSDKEYKEPYDFGKFLLVADEFIDTSEIKSKNSAENKTIIPEYYSWMRRLNMKRFFKYAVTFIIAFILGFNICYILFDQAVFKQDKFEYSIKTTIKDLREGLDIQTR